MQVNRELEHLRWDTVGMGDVVSCYKVYLVVLPPNQIFLPMLITFKKPSWAYSFCRGLTWE